MSFSSDVKNELYGHISSSRHCQIAELAAMFLFCGRMVRRANRQMSIRLQTENPLVARKCFTLLKKTFNINSDVLVRCVVGRTSRTYCICIQNQEEVKRLFGALKIGVAADEQISMLTSNSCCKRAFLRGVFLAAGSISDPEHSYHFELACDSDIQAGAIHRLINSFETGDVLGSKIIKRKRYHVVYIKEGSQIVDILNIMGAHVSLLELENLRVLKDMRNRVNRRVNCETANINKTVSAAVKQIDDIKFLRDNGGFHNLSPALIEMAELRLENPEVPLKELGELLDPPVGKSGVNHRLRKISELAETMRESMP